MLRMWSPKNNIGELLKKSIEELLITRKGIFNIESSIETPEGPIKEIEVLNVENMEQWAD